MVLISYALLAPLFAAPAGTWEAPTEVDLAAPRLGEWELEEGRPDHIQHYTCVPARSMPGSEVVFGIAVDEPGLLLAELRSPRAPDLELLLLRAPTPEQALDTDCLAHGTSRLTVPALDAGHYLLVADSRGATPSGTLELAVELQPEGRTTHRTMDIAPGVQLQGILAREPEQPPQTITVLTLAPERRDQLVARRHDGCEPVAVVGERLGAIAGSNASFFSKRCEPLCLLASEGMPLTQNRMGKGPQRSLGWSAGEPPRWAWVDEELDWRGVDFAVAGYPSLVSAGEVQVDPKDDSSFQTDRHPRTAIGVQGDGSILLVTVDGRTPAGAGMSMAELAATMLELGAEDAINLDGGGSTTLWVPSAWPGGVVNHPSDNGLPDHNGARAVSDGLYVLPSPEPSSSRSTRGGEGSSLNKAR